MNSFYDGEFALADGSMKALSDCRGKVVLVVNTASKCGFTPQYDGLEKLHRKYAEQGLEVIGFPCNQFGKQEPGSMEEITNFCRLNYELSFPLAKKVEVNGDGAHPLYKFLKDAAPGILGSKSIKWNFTKFLINREGKVVQRFASATPPRKIEAAIEALL